MTAQPTTLRGEEIETTARQSQPSSIHTCRRSAAHSSFGLSAEKSRSTRLGAIVKA